VVWAPTLNKQKQTPPHTTQLIRLTFSLVLRPSGTLPLGKAGERGEVVPGRWVCVRGREALPVAVPSHENFRHHWPEAAQLRRGRIA
jgi:hypothetical protein